MFDPPGIEFLDVGTGGRDADHLVSGGLKRAQLWAEEQRKTDIGRRHVDEPRPSFRRVQCRP